MPKMFVISDIHGYYDEMIEALDAAGFDKNNEEHWLITCGDHFDRGKQPIKIMKYLMSLPRKVLVKGNHEGLLVDMCERGMALSHDISNGTALTAVMLDPSVDLCNINLYDLDYNHILRRVKPFFDSMVNYFETKNYIFVHSWIPLFIEDSLPAYYTRDRSFRFNPNWREASDGEWNSAMWGNPYDLAQRGFLPDKHIVFGHFHTSYPRMKYEGKPEWGEDADFSIYNGDGYTAIDACTVHSGKCNVLVLEDEFLEE